MSEWCELKLGSVVLTNANSVDKNYMNKSILYLDTGSITKGKIEGFQEISLKDAPSRAKRLVKPNDIVYSTVRPIQRHYGILKNPQSNLVVSTGFTVIETNQKLAEPQFIYYLLSSDESVEFLDVIAEASTSTYPSLKPSDIENLDISLPSLPEQKAIASVLSSLDDKIDLLHRQNITLESMAETLFRQWFVEEAKEDWSFVVLGEYVNCFNGVSYKSSELNASKTAMVTLKSFDRNGGFRLDGFKEFTGRYKEQHIVVQGDLVVAHTDITQNAEVIGNPILVVASPSYETIVISMDLVKVTTKFDWLSNEFLYRMMRTREFKEHCLGYSNGSTVLHLSKQAIPSYEFFLPPKEKIQSFTANVKDLLGKKFKNIEQIQTLEKLRDTLLPKLMSGEVRVELNGEYHDAI